MATTYPTHGSGGKVIVGSAAVAMLTSWSTSSSTGGTYVRFAGATNLTYLSDGMTEHSVQIEGILNAGDTAQAALLAGGAVTLVLHPDSGVAGDDTWSCSGSINANSISLGIDGPLTFSATVAVSGALTKGVVAGG